MFSMTSNRWFGAGRIAYAPDDAVSAPPSTDVAPVVDAPAPVAAPVAEPAAVLYPGDAPPVAAPVADPLAETPAPMVEPPAGPDLAGLSPEDAAAVTEAWEAMQADKAARKVELDAMTPEDRAIAEKADADAEAAELIAATVPADGVYALTMPDGVELDTELLTAISPDLAALSLTNGQAQQMANTFTAAMQAKATKAAEAWAATVSGWVETAKADPEMGGAKWDATVKDATFAIGKFGSPALKEYLGASGGGNNPEMIRAWAKVGAAISEDKPATTETPNVPAPAADKAAVLYPNDLPKGK